MFRSFVVMQTPVTANPHAHHCAPKFLARSLMLLFHRTIRDWFWNVVSGSHRLTPSRRLPPNFLFYRLFMAKGFCTRKSAREIFFGSENPRLWCWMFIPLPTRSFQRMLRERMAFRCDPEKGNCWWKICLVHSPSVNSQLFSFDSASSTQCFDNVEHPSSHIKSRGKFSPLQPVRWVMGIFAAAFPRWIKDSGPILSNRACHDLSPPQHLRKYDPFTFLPAASSYSFYQRSVRRTEGGRWLRVGRDVRESPWQWCFAIFNFSHRIESYQRSFIYCIQINTTTAV